MCRWCLNSYANEYNLMNPKEKCGKHDIFTIRTSSDSHFNWKNHFQIIQFFSKTFANFEAGNKIDNSSTGNETTII